MELASLRFGAENIATRFLRVSAGDDVGLMSWQASELSVLLAAAVSGAGGNPVTVDLSDLKDAGQVRATTTLTRRMAHLTSSVLLAKHGIPPRLSMGILDTAVHLRLRHLHLTRIDPRLFIQSYRADPDLIARINERVVHHLTGARALSVSSRAGTRLEIRLDHAYPLLAADGRPEPARPDNLPSGTVNFHPARVDGVFVADRGAIGAVRPDTALLRRHPLTFHIENGVVVEVESRAPELATLIKENYAKLHKHALHVGLIAVPTNYVIRSETGLEVQDALLPGVNVILGYSNEAASRAPFKCPVQLRLFARGLTVSAGAVQLVKEGRLVDGLVRDVDPFRAC